MITPFEYSVYMKQHKLFEYIMILQGKGKKILVHDCEIN